jgi:EAL domain-containing protein (putative c-di-GMP-specific phosphodiesterase class I)
VLTYSEQDEIHLNNLYWIREIKAALAEGRLISHYQLIAPAYGSAVCKYESLLRLVDRSGSIISPNHFLDIIKHTKYYPSITRQVVRRAIATAAKHGCHISINLSAEDIDNRETRDFILGELRQHGGSNLIFEITEGESLKDYEEVKAFIRSIRAYDAAIAIDDFGSGYSNFSYLVELQPEFIKIDGSIISGILTDKNSLLVTESIIDLAHKIGARVIAEFVSSDEIANALRELGVDFLQGFAVGKPGPFA